MWTMKTEAHESRLAEALCEWEESEAAIKCLISSVYQDGHSMTFYSRAKVLC